MFRLSTSAVTSSDSTNQPTPITEAYTYRCVRGGFKTTLPAGCGSVRENWSEPHPEADPLTAMELIYIFCDQHGEEGSGVAVTAIFNERNAAGEAAGPPEVMARALGLEPNSIGLEALDMPTHGALIRQFP